MRAVEGGLVALGMSPTRFLYTQADFDPCWFVVYVVCACACVVGEVCGLWGVCRTWYGKHGD